MHTIKQLQEIIAKGFGEAVFLQPPDRLYEPINYTLEQGGKRLRPLLVLLSCELFGGDMRKALFPAMGLEIFHNFTLLHDDIMDHAPLRRGRETVHTRWDVNTAILSGDTMFVIAYEYVAKTDPGLLPAVLNLFNDTARKVCEGQQYDMDFETADHVTIDEYTLMIRLKTAVLIACSLKLGAIVAGAPDEMADAVYEAGINLGLAFQLQDDYLDAFGDESKFGKSIGGDILARKKTCLYLHAMEKATPVVRQKLQDLYFSADAFPAAKISGVKAIFTELGVDEITREEIQHYHQLALKGLSSLGFPGNRSGELFRLMNEMLGREK